MKPYFIYARELDQGIIAINLLQVSTVTRGTVKSSGEDVTLIKMSNGKEVIARMKFEEFQAEIDWWGNEADGFASRVENEHAWKVSIDEVIARNFNLDIKNPHQAEAISHDPDELLAQYQQQQNEINQLRHQLRDILGAALAGKEVN